MKKTSNGSEVLRTEVLSKRYGRITAVDSLNIRLLQGEVFGFLGPNGSGKSTNRDNLTSLGFRFKQPGDGRIRGTISLLLFSCGERRTIHEGRPT